MNLNKKQTYMVAWSEKKSAWVLSWTEGDKESGEDVYRSVDAKALTVRVA